MIKFKYLAWPLHKYQLLSRLITFSSHRHSLLTSVEGFFAHFKPRSLQQKTISWRRTIIDVSVKMRSASLPIGERWEVLTRKQWLVSRAAAMRQEICCAAFSFDLFTSDLADTRPSECADRKCAAIASAVSAFHLRRQRVFRIYIKYFSFLRRQNAWWPAKMLVVFMRMSRTLSVLS
jgi:hypothetical protein